MTFWAGYISTTATQSSLLLASPVASPSICNGGGSIRFDAPFDLMGSGDIVLSCSTWQEGTIPNRCIFNNRRLVKACKVENVTEPVVNTHLVKESNAIRTENGDT